MSENNLKDKKLATLQSTKILQDSFLPLSIPDKSETTINLSSMIKIGAKNVFKIEQLAKDERQIPSIVDIEDSLLLKRKSLELNFSFLHSDPQFKQTKKLPLEIHGRKRIYRVKTTILKPLCHTITKIFKGTDFNDGCVKLTETEFHLVNVFIDKRFKLGLTGLERPCGAISAME